MHIIYLADINNPHTLRWVNYFASLNHHVTVLCDYPADNPPSNITILHPHMSLLTKIVAFKLFPKPYGNNFFKFLPYRKIIQSLKPDIIHGMEALGYGFATSLAGNYPKILTPWGNDIYYDPRHSRIARFLVNYALHHVDAITTNMPNLSEYLIREFNVPEQKIKAFSWGVNLTIFNPDKNQQANALRDILKIPLEAPVIISHRRCAPYWGMDSIVQAMGKFLREYKDVHFIFLRSDGESDYFNAKSTELQNYGISDRFHPITDYLTPDQMSIHLNASNAFISFPHTDLLSISVIEGMACGAIPIVADLPSYKTRLSVTNAFWAEPHKTDSLLAALQRCFSNKTDWDKIINGNWEVIKKEEDWSKQALLMQNLYESVIKQFHSSHLKDKTD